MNVTINSVKFKADPKLEKFVADKVGKIERLVDNATKCEVTLKVDKPESDNNKIAELRIIVPGKDLFVTKQADTFEQAVADGVDTLKVQIEKYKNA